MEQISKIIYSLVLVTVIVKVKSELPKDLKDPILFCEGCYGSMYEIDAFMIRLKHETLKTRIENTLDEVCHTDNLRKYVFSPPKMTKVCKAMVSNFREDLEVYLHAKYKHGQIVEDPYELVKEFCIDGGTKACIAERIPSVERKKEQLRKASAKNEEL